MSYSRSLILAGVAAGLMITGSFVACVGDSGNTDDATAPDTGSDVSQTGCLARTADDGAGVFVATTGGDVSGCGTRGNPCKTLTFALNAAKTTSSKTTLYVSSGTYTESLILDTPLSIEGGWKDTGGTWAPVCDATTSTAVTIAGTTNVTITASYTGSATLRDVKIVSKSAANHGETLYGVFAVGAATNLTLDSIVTDIGAGGSGVDGTPGAMGASANDAGCTTSDGGPGGTGANGTGGSAGGFSSTGYVATNGDDAGMGAQGQGGTAFGQGQCQTCQAFVGTCPGNCGFGNQQVCGTNGRSGCGGVGGSPGAFGTGGGSSIAVFVWDAKVTIFGGSLAASNGGNGGNGGAGGDGGAGTNGVDGSTAICPTSLSNPGCLNNFCTGILNSSTTLAAGTAGGAGGSGGTGGQGGGGSGGVSYTIVQGGDAGSVTLNANPKLLHGDGGTGGAAGGAGGGAGDKFP